MTSRRKRVYLTIAEKYQVILMMERGEPRRGIMKKYNIARRTLYKIYAHREEIRKQFETGTLAFSRSVRRLSRRRMADVDRVVFHWYLRCKERKIEMTGANIQEKAIEINEKLNGYPGFKASTTWLLNFKVRYGISTANTGEDLQMAIEFAQAEAFTNHFLRLLTTYGFTLKNVYNVVYTEMIWKGLPRGTSIPSSANSTGSQKMCEDYVTALFCANATGCHKLPVLIIGNDPNSENLNNFNTEAFSTIYISKTNPCMDSTIFTQWYKEHFLESVKQRQEWENGRREQTLLLLDNAKSLHNLDDLNKIDPFVTVITPPLPVSALVQPMNCGIIICFKRKYRIKLLEAITPLPIYNTEREMIYLHKHLSMWDCCRIVHDAWANVDVAILINSWDSLLKPRIMRNMQDTDAWTADIGEILELLDSLPGRHLCQEIDVINWFHIDNSPDIIMKICADEVLHEYKNNILRRVNTDTTDNQAGPSHS